MARLTDLPHWERSHHLDRIDALPDYGITPFATGPAPNRPRVAIVATARLHLRGDRAFEVGSADDRVIPGDTAAARAFLVIQYACLRSEDTTLVAPGKLALVPRAVSHALAEQARVET